MNFTKKIAILVLVSSSVLSTQAFAQTQSSETKNALERIVSTFVSNAVATASNEIDIQLEKITLTASNVISVEPTSNITTKVLITDVTEATSELIEQDNNSDKANQSEESND